jgi:hypothetical protein
MPDKTPRLFRVRTAEDLEHIPFEDGMAAVEVPAHLLDKLELKNFERGQSPRLDALERSIRARGFQPVEPITARIGKKGRWVVVNGGHRLTAAKHVMREFWTNLFGPKVRSVYFVLFTDPGSWTKVTGPHPPVNAPTSTEAASVRAEWEESRRRRLGIDEPPEAPSAPRG